MKHKNAFASIKRVRFPNVGINIFIWELLSETMIMPSILINYICSKLFEGGTKQEKTVLRERNHNRYWG